MTDAGRLRDRVPIRRIGRVLGALLLLAVVLPFVIYAVPQIAGANSSYVVLSGSMQPVMDPGDVVVVESVPASEIEKGDIVTFHREGQANPTTHRVIEVVQQGGDVAFRTKGDNSESADRRLVTPAQLEGRIPVIAGYPLVIPLIGHVIFFASTQTGFVLLVAVPIGLLIISEIWSLSGISGASGESDTDDTLDTAAKSGTDQPAGDGVRSTNEESADDDRPLAHVDSAAIAGGSGISKTTMPNGHGIDTDGHVAAGNGDNEIQDTNGVVSDAVSPTEDDNSSLTFTAPELELGLVVLGLFVGYSAWVAAETVEIWAFTVVGAVGAAFLLLSILYLVGRSGSSSEREASSSGGVELDRAELREQLIDGRTRAVALTDSITRTELKSAQTVSAQRTTTVDGRADPMHPPREGVNDD
ncbi:Signal peptidase I [Halapricum desulfuricans]|uniref:Signal peptidase I n=1 Tax=Halapricum desulfuricans TaxID=2841257 RepID=A0A897NJV8_9EURY|nr:signal peptidase I [Halapricum desulfuricans]QSG11735.1 Signal peptidase I [Halapricum desulfuricans]